MAAEGSSSDVVKSCHRHLRAAVNKGEDVHKVWHEHVRDRIALSSYSEAMRALATGPWREGGAACDRISWCVQTCSEYVDHRLEELLLKDLRRICHDAATVVEHSLLPASSSGVRALVHGLRERELRLLDVGSCYNPFLSFPQFQVTAIDIAPASETVLRRDFLNVEIVEDDFKMLKSNQMKAGTFDIVIFSMLLSYFPCCKQRYLCCVNGHKVLRPHGLLLVVTPDSSHQNRHAPLMVQWKLCIEALGFHRWKYEKLPHLHCMAFRKTQPNKQEYVATEHHLTIPQDRQTVP